MACQGCGSILINYSGDPEVVGEAGNFNEPYYDRSKFSQPTGLGLDGFGTSRRNEFRRPPAWNVDLSLFKAFPFGRFRPEFRMDFTNVFNHVNWGAPNTTFTAPNFMLYAPANPSGVGYSDTSSNTPGPRRIQLGFRCAFSADVRIQRRWTDRPRRAGPDGPCPFLFPADIVVRASTERRVGRRWVPPTRRVVRAGGARLAGSVALLLA
jgi:hypothetical protein